MPRFARPSRRVKRPGEFSRLLRMSGFAQSLQQFQDGERTSDALLTELDTILVEGTLEPTALLTSVLDEHTKQPLKDEVFTAIVSRINTHIEKTLTGAQAEGPGQAPIALAINRPDKVAPGTVLNERFELVEKIGEGGMSQVFKALDRRKLEAKSRHPHVALKVMDVSSRNQSAAFMALQREAQKSQTLTHPNIVRAFDFDRDDDVVFMTMEHLSGDSLASVIRQAGEKGVPADQAVDYLQQMGAALAHAHANRIVHADFKPTNVVVTEEGQVKVIDFGIARAYRRPDDTMDDKTVFDPRDMGALTPAYASPEMFENQEPDPKDDIYSLGCVAYELFTGEHPFAKSRATDARAAGITARKPAALNERQWRAVQHALAFDREARTPSVTQFLEEFMPPVARPAAPPLWRQPGAWVLAALACAALGWVALRGDGVVVAPADVTAIPDGGLFRDCARCPTMVRIPKGPMQLGSPESEVGRWAFEGPQYVVQIQHDFALSEAEITVRDFREYVDAATPELEGCHTLHTRWQLDATKSWRDPGFKQGNAHPVTCVSWQDAQGYVDWLSTRTGARYRLPTEAEWEYAARAGIPDARTWLSAGDACAHGNLADQSAGATFTAWDVFPCNDGHVYTAAVKEGEANAFGLFDTEGNVFEWTQDCWNPGYAAAATDGGANETGDCAARILRGGSFFTAPSEQRLAFRNRFAPDYRSHSVGFRIARDLP